jgi:bla regulator protein BlaR1
MSLALQSLISNIGWTLVHFIWQGLLLGCATAVALTAMRNARPQHRYAVACTALLLCLAWPAFELIARMAASDVSSDTLHGAARLLLAGPAADAGVLGWFQNRLLWIVAAWAICAGALTLRMGLGLLWIGRAAKTHATDAHWQAHLSSLASRFGVTRDVRLRVVDNLASPITAGWWRPVVLVPASLISGMPPDLLEALLAHEIGHIKRLDYLVNLGQNVIEILLFYHPAVWWISGRIRIEREQIADDFAARQLGEPRRLALALSELERFQFSTHHLAQAASGGDLMSRIKRLVRPDTQALNWKAAIPVLGLAACLTACASVKTADSSPTLAAAGITKPVVQFKGCAKPEWPVASLQAQHTGTVTLEFLVSAEGRAIGSKVLKSSGDPALDEAARKGIARCPFTPGTDNGKPVEAPAHMQYVWTLV